MPQLNLKSLNCLLGSKFYIPSYQRGYRWTPQQVKDLLNDFRNFMDQPYENENIFYCLQPIVVKEHQWKEQEVITNGWEVIDGQQRLTTIFIILSYLTKEFLQREDLLRIFGKNIYSIYYQTRPKSSIFLNDIKDDRTNIDFHYISQAYRTVKEWFTVEMKMDYADHLLFLMTLLSRKDHPKSIQVIWYNVASQEDGNTLFKRLNKGRIPLTNAELIKALFLSEDNNIETENRKLLKLEISRLWDDIEQHLSNPRFWHFITNAPMDKYQTKIELIFDLIAEKRDNVQPDFTFLHFQKNSLVKNALQNQWSQVEHYYRLLCEWTSDKDLWHQIGYLILVGEDPGELLKSAVSNTKSSFNKIIHNKIHDSIEGIKDKNGLSDLNFEEDYHLITKVLMLFNIETIRNTKSITEWYPFEMHKGERWSLEHIHARNTELLIQNKREIWKDWLLHHEKTMKACIAEGNSNVDSNTMQQLISEINSCDMEKISGNLFNDLASKIITVFSDNTEEYTSDVHAISNLALISVSQNAALNNGVFEVKRQMIIDIDKKGEYIPTCTRRVFLKYYNNEPGKQHFWTRNDRNSYLEEISKTIAPYLKKVE